MLFNEIENIIALSYSELGSTGHLIAKNFNNGYGKSKSQKILFRKGKLIQMELKTVLDHVVYDDDGNVTGLLRSTDEQINKSLTYLIDLSEIQDYSTGPTLFHKLKPRIINTTNTIQFQYSANGTDWHSAPMNGDVYFRTSADAGSTWSAATLFLDTSKVSKAGDTMTGALAMSSQKITGLGNGTNANDAINKSQLDALKTYADGLVIGLWDDRGSYNASVNSYPSTGGSGTAGAILKGDIWTVSVAGTLPTGLFVEVGDTVRALVDSPTNTQGDWAILSTVNTPWALVSLVWGPFAQPTTAGQPSIQYRKQGSIVYVKGYVRATSTFGSGTRIMTLPSGFRPPYEQRVFIPKQFEADEEMHLRIYANGEIYIVREAATFTQVDILLPEFSFSIDGLLAT